MDDEQLALAAARQLVAQHLESLARAGVLQIGKVPASVGNALRGVPSVADKSRAAGPPTPSPAQDTPMPRAKPAPVLAGMSLLTQPYPQDIPAGAADRQRLLDQLNDQVRGCKLCAVLAKQRTQTVFGVGNPAARIVFFGEAPGADE